MPDPFLEQAILLIEKAQSALSQFMPPSGEPSQPKDKQSDWTPPRYRANSYIKNTTPAYRSPQAMTTRPRYRIESVAIRPPSNGLPILLMLLSAMGGIPAVMLSLIGIVSTLTGQAGAAGALFGFLLPSTILCTIVFCCNAVASARNQRLRRYLSEIGAARLCELSRLAERVQLPLHKIQKDFVWLIRSGKNKGIYLDEQRTCLILDQETYQQYLELKRNVQLRAKEQQSLPEETKEQVSEILREGNGYLSRIREAHGALSGAEIGQKLDRLEQITAEIFRHVQEHPSKQSDVRRMVQYHLPTTLKLVDTYRQLETRPVQGENILSIRQEILKSLDMVSAAFEQLLDDLYAEVALDISSDISVLNAMLAQEGLMGANDFKPDAQTESK